MEDPAFEHLESTRLRIRRFHAADADIFARYRSDPEVARLQGWEAPFSLDQARQFIEEVARLSPGAAGEWFQFAVTLRDNATLIGDCALRATPSDPRQAELGFSFATRYQRHGYAAEAVRCVVHYAFTTLDMRRIFAITDARNERARRLLERTGFRREGHFVENVWFKGEWASELSFAQLRSEWQRTQHS